MNDTKTATFNKLRAKYQPLQSSSIAGLEHGEFSFDQSQFVPHDVAHEDSVNPRSSA
jgi:hypothetical protein